MLNFTIKQLRYVEAAGRLGSIAKAAAEMNISQSSITAAIDALEQSLDYDIFVRTPAKGIKATPAGLETLQHIRGFMDQSRHFESEIQSVGGAAAGLVRIACYATAAPSFLPPILKSLTEKIPGVSVTFLEGDMLEVTDFLENGEADLAFTYLPDVESKFRFEPLFEAPPYALLSTEDPLSWQESVTLDELAERPMILLDLPMTRDYFGRLFAEKSLYPKIVHTSRSSEICRSLVASGVGFTILNICPPENVGDGAPYHAVPISSEDRAPVFGIVTLANVRQPKTVRATWQCCLELKQSDAFEKIVVQRPES
ncbi:MAG: LysR family transcriptional regulator [Pikeienuella sp.]